MHMSVDALRGQRCWSWSKTGELPYRGAWKQTLFSCCFLNKAKTGDVIKEGKGRRMTYMERTKP